MTQHFTVTELAFGRQKGTNPRESVCILADIRDQSKPASVQVWSYGKEKIVNLPRSVLKVHTPRSVKWWAISLPRWLADREGLWGGEPAAIGGDAERAEAESIIALKNRTILRPGQRMTGSTGMARSSNAGT
jgi:hypothetical protein